MDRWSDFGLLGKAACISFVGAMPGIAVAVGLGKLFNSNDLMIGLLIIWFLPGAIWAVLAFASAAKSEYPTTAGCLTIFALLGALGNPSTWESLPFILIGCPIVTAAMAIIGKPAEAMLAVGRGKSRSTRGIDL